MLEASKVCDEEAPNNGNIVAAKSKPDRRNTIDRDLSLSARFLPYHARISCPMNFVRGSAG